MAVKIAKSATSNVVTIGGSDYPLDSFRAQYKGNQLILIPKYHNLLSATRLKFMYADLVDGDDAPVGTTDAAVQTYIQANIYSAVPATEPAA